MLYLFIFTWKGQAALLQRRGLTPGMTASGDIFRGHNRESASDSRWEEARMVLNTPRCTGSADNEGVHGAQADKPWRGWAGPGTLSQTAWDGSPVGPGPVPRLQKGQRPTSLHWGEHETKMRLHRSEVAPHAH